MMESPTTRQQVPIIDLACEYRDLKSEIDSALERVLSTGSYVLGQETSTFETALSVYCGTAHAVGVNSGTDALLIALRALDITSGDDVIVPAMSFIATVEPIVQLGARPVFVDIDPLSYAIQPEQVRAKITSRTKAVIAVHLYGHMADMTALRAICDDARVPLIEDMAQAIGSEWEGKKAGSAGNMACLSFFPTKNLGACGDAGAVLTSSDSLAERANLLRNHGAKIKYQHEEIGYNTRLDEIQAAILIVKLKHLDAWNDKRRRLAARYTQAFQGLPLICPQELKSAKHVFHLYSIQTERRDALRSHLAEEGIATGLHYPTPLHLQSALRFLGHRSGEFPTSERLAQKTLSLPLYPQMSDEQQDRVVEAVRSFSRLPPGN